MSAYCERVRTGQALAAETMVPRTETKRVRRLCAESGCRVQFSEFGSEDFLAARIYRRPHAQLIMRELFKDGSGRKPTALEMWATGKLFGYAEAEIEAFLRASGYLRSR